MLQFIKAVCIGLKEIHINKKINKALKYLLAQTEYVVLLPEYTENDELQKVSVISALDDFSQKEVIVSMGKTFETEILAMQDLVDNASSILGESE